jgi:hypothetical protein
MKEQNATAFTIPTMATSTNSNGFETARKDLVRKHVLGIEVRLSKVIVPK